MSLAAPAFLTNKTLMRSHVNKMILLATRATAQNADAKVLCRQAADVLMEGAELLVQQQLAMEALYNTVVTAAQGQARKRKFDAMDQYCKLLTPTPTTKKQTYASSAARSAAASSRRAVASTSSRPAAGAQAKQ